MRTSYSVRDTVIGSAENTNAAREAFAEILVFLLVAEEAQEGVPFQPAYPPA